MKKLVIDVDGTLTVDSGLPYAEKKPRTAVIEKLREYHDSGFHITLFSARNMRTYEGQIGKINVMTLPILTDWLNRHDVPYDEIIMGKPWCGFDGFYVDDKSVRPDEFVNMNYERIAEMLGLGSGE